MKSPSDFIVQWGAGNQTLLNAMARPCPQDRPRVNPHGLTEIDSTSERRKRKAGPKQLDREP